MIRIISIVFLLFLNSCDYSPLYSKNKNSNFSIDSLQISGDKDLNAYLKKGLALYVNENSEKKYKILIETSFSKNILAKDKSANTTDYKLIASVQMDFIKINLNNVSNENRKIRFEEFVNIKKNSNTFEQTTYEYISKTNLAEIILDKIILVLNKN